MNTHKNSGLNKLKIWKLATQPWKRYAMKL